MRLLVAEDQPRLAALLGKGLEEEGYAVDLAGDGELAHWLAMENEYDVIVLDVMLPGMDGFSLCRQLREAGRSAPVIMLTARDAVTDRVRGLDAGADDYMVKPFSFSELCARIRALIRRGHPDRSPVLEAGELRLEPARRRLWRGDAEVALSPKEFALMELLMRHRGEVLTRTTILEHVWDFAYDPASNVVDQYVAYLRRKIDDPGEPSHIETVRGVGYRLHDAEG